MSKEFLQKLLDEEIKLVSRSRKEIDKTAKYTAHKISMSSIGVYNAIMAQLYKLQAAEPSVLSSEQTIAFVRRGADVIVHFVYRRAEMFQSTKENVQVVGNRSAFSAIVTESSVITETGYPKHQNVYEFIRGWYRRPLTSFTNDLNAYLASQGSDTQIGTLLDLGHRGSSAIARETINTSQARIKSAIKDSGSDVQITDKDLKRLGLTFSIEKKSTPEADVYELGLEDLIGNREEGFQVLGPKKQKYLAALKNAQKKLAKDMILSESSDSRPTIEKKKIIETFESSVRAGKNVKKTNTDTKLDLANSKVSTTISKKAKKGNSISANTAAPLKGVNKRSKRSSSESSITLGALINQKITETVAKNMELPALRYRSGRFAASVRITDVVKTQQGYPSIGYTYQKYPYQTFELGGKQGSSERDPRKLIDRSIREIAAGLLVGRFYTRRV